MSRLTRRLPILLVITFVVAAVARVHPTAAMGSPGPTIFEMRGGTTAGGLNWARLLGGNRPTSGGPLAQASNGDILMAGAVRSRDATTTDYRQWDVLVARLTSDGKLLWRVEIGGDGQDIPVGIGELGDGRIAVAGYSTSSEFNGVRGHGGYDAVTVVLGPRGDVRWTRLSGGKGDELASSLAIAGDRMVVGGYRFRPTFDPCAQSDGGFVLAYGSTGRRHWSATVKRTKDLATSVLGVVVSNGVITVVGSELERCGPHESHKTSTGFVARLSLDGVPLRWSRVESVVRLDNLVGRQGAQWALGTRRGADGRRPTHSSGSVLMVARRGQ